MDIRNALKEYFEKTPVPVELDPRNVSRFVVPKVTEKRETQTADQIIAEMDARAAASVRAPQPIPQPQNIPRPKNIPQQEPPLPAEISRTAEEEPYQKDTAIGASAFIKIVRYHKLTGKEFLSILGNSKIRNTAYQEIENNPGLTVKRLIELLEESPLTSEDYEKLIIAVQRMAQLKAEARAKIKAEPARNVRSVSNTGNTAGGSTTKEIGPAKTASFNTPAAKASVKKPGNVHEPSYGAEDENIFDEYYGRKKSPKKTGAENRKNDYYEKYDDVSEEDDETEEEYEVRKNNNGSEKPKTVIDFGDDDDDDADKDDENDDDNDENDDNAAYDSFGRKKKSSNKGKIAAAAVGAVVLVGISFGLRYYLTGSPLPYDGSQIEEKTVDTSELFEMLSGLPSPSPAFVQNTLYSAGGIREESLLKESVCNNKRFLYIAYNKLYIYEQIGGQIAQLDVKDYGENTLLGLIETENNIAVISVGTSEPYSFSYSIPSESGADTVATGTVERKETFVELLDPYAPEKNSEKNTLRLSGTLAAAYLQGSRIIAVTYEEIESGSVSEDPATFMPYLYNGEGRQLCAADKVFISSNPSNKGFVSIFSIDSDGSFDIAAAAGGSAQLISKSGKELFIGQGNTLIRYSVGNGAEQDGFCSLSGSISSFSGISVNNEEIRVTVLEDSAAALTVLDGELSKTGEVKNIGVGEILLGTCFNGKETYIVTENGTCYGIDGDNNVMSQSSVKITNENIYRYSDSIGIKVTAADDGSKRTGLIVSTVKLDGTLNTLYSLEISSKTVAENALDEYISSPAEENVSYIGGTEENGAAVIPVMYFDGVSEVELFVICMVSEDGILSVNGVINAYDRHSDYIFAKVDGDTVIAVTKGRITTANLQDGAVKGYFNVSM